MPRYPAEPKAGCTRCPRLVAFRRKNAQAYPTYFNGAAPSFGPETASALIVGMAPGLHGANKTGRVFTGDASGEMLYSCLAEAGLTSGVFENDPKDGFDLAGIMITNAVRCVPPENKPTAAEVAKCRPFLETRIRALPNLKALFALGKIAHDATLRTLGLRLADYPFAHQAVHTLPNGLVLVDSYHCSRYNVNTKRLTREMFLGALNELKEAADL
ncbi:MULTISPECIES: uracil-DNA glycosylase [Kordiimonas]|jgi:uracil-DNA glycosylase family 4|uniref:uracil-DNA glycosylase n=1 Tax=Kordiimonas TaxID=288021 RepID=UPI002580D880|nr:uracil-DNA glycosylase [Kordiimonas sp. UBA4487]